MAIIDKALSDAFLSMRCKHSQHFVRLAKSVVETPESCSVYHIPKEVGSIIPSFFQKQEYAPT